MDSKIRYRVTFEKKGPAKFIGHLDLQTLFQRSLKRAEIPVAYSKGFNPHMLISFAQPLPLGMESVCEMVDIETVREMDADVITTNMNNALPDGLRVIKAVLLPSHAKRVAAAVFSAEYTVTLNPTVSINVKTKDEYANIADKIHSLHYAPSEHIITMTLRAGGEVNLKPTVAVTEIFTAAGLDYRPGDARYTRTSINLKSEIQ